MTFPASLETEFENIFDEKRRSTHISDKTEIGRRNIFCKAITESSPDILNKMIAARDKGEIAKLGEMIRSCTLSYELQRFEGQMDHDELYHYAKIRADMQDTSSVTSKATATGKIHEYESKYLLNLSPYLYSRVKQCLELYLRFKAIKEK